MAQLKDTVVSGNLRVTDTINAHDVKLDGGTNNGVTINYDSSVGNYSGINYYVGNVIQSQFGWYRPSSGTGTYYYFGGPLSDTRAYHDQFYSKKYTVASSSSTSYNAAITGSFTANRDITVPDASGTLALGASSGAAYNLNVNRVSKNANNALPGLNKLIMEEFDGASGTNTPTTAYHHILSSQGSDSRYGVQLALGMTAEGAYYRRYNNSSWGTWKPLTSLTVYDSSTGTTTTPAFSIPPGYNAIRITVKISGAAMTSTFLCSLKTGQVDWGGFIQSDSTVEQGLIVGKITPILIKRSGNDSSTTLTLYRGKTYTFVPWGSTTETVVITDVELIP
jgi:hypothetical protein